MKIVGFKLISGEELIGKLNEKESTEEVIVLEDPCAFVMMQTPQGLRGTFMPYVQGNPLIKELAFPARHLTCLPFEVSADVSGAYMQSSTEIDLSAAKPTGLKLVTP